MPRIKVSQKSGVISVYEGDKPKEYTVENGEIAVSDGHVAAILTSVPGSELVQEAPGKKEK